jgi:hypothetical protein
MLKNSDAQLLGHEGISWLIDREIGEVRVVLLAWYQEFPGEKTGCIYQRRDDVN